MKKKKLLFVIESLTCAGAEKSLVTLLSLIDYEKYEVDLQLFRYGGEFERFLPKQVNVLPPLLYFKFLEKTLFRQILSLDLAKLRARFLYSLNIRRKVMTHPQKAVEFWRCTAAVFSTPSIKNYDVAIAYAQGVPTFYVADMVKATKKIAWVNTTLRLKGTLKNAQSVFYEKMDNIVCVSETALDVFQNVYPEFGYKMTMIRDIINPALITEMSMHESEFCLHAQDNAPILLTVARLNNKMKGYDIALEAARILRDRGVRYRWYALGRGGFREEMENYIKENHLENNFILLGTTPNPYPCFKACTIYVQTSRIEGFGLSIAEARILNRPVVTTNYDSVYDQMVQGKNGLVVPQSPEAVADAIEKLLTDKQLYESIVDYQKQEKKGNIEELDKFYRLIES